MSYSESQPNKTTLARSPDTGGPDVQIRFLTERINSLSLHLDTHKRDYSTQRGLLILVARRKHLLKYLKAHRPETYQGVIQSLDLRK